MGNGRRTNADHQPYIQKGKYWQIFGHMYSVNASEELKRRMLRLKEEDEKQHGKKFGG